MDPFKIVQFDIRGTNPDNRIIDEKMLIKDKTCPWIIPNGSPFFAEQTLTKIYDQRGAELTLGRDYFFEQEFVPFCDLSGRSICTFIRLSDAVLAANSFVTGTYQSIGAWFVPRNNLDEWLDKMTHGKIPVPWAKVFGVPPTLPPELHKHTVITEIGDWYELSFFWNYMAGIYRTRDVGIYEEADIVINDAFEQLKAIKLAQLARINAHDSDYNVPHGTTKFHIELGNLDNFGTATPADELAGTRADLFSTPLGVQQLAASYQPDTQQAMRAGIIPISQLGNDSFIPPMISGSFEGMGQQTECSAICLEPNGLVMLLSNHNDGRTKGLYFSVVENYNKDNIKITYTNYKYKPPVLASLGYDVDRVIAGSGNKVIMTGVLGTNDWFIALTNNTLDPAAHNYVRCDMSAVTAFFGSPYGNQPVFGNHDQATIHHMGAYLVLVQSWNDAGVPKSRMYRVLTEDVRAGRDVAWAAMALTYVDWDGTQYNGVTDFVPQKNVRNANNKVVSFGRFLAKQPFDFISSLRRHLNVSWPQTGGGGNHYIHFQSYFHMSYTDTTGVPYANIVAGVSEMFYIINPANGAMSLQFRSPQVLIDFLPGADPLAGYRQYREFTTALVGYQSPATVVFPTGEMLSAVIFEGAAEFPVRLQVTSFNGVTSAEGLLSRALDTDVTSVKSQRVTTPVVVPATKNGCFPGTLTYEADGELFEAADQTDPALNRKTYYRKVSGGYAIREGVNNLTLGANIYSRPLTTEIYLSNLLHTDGTMSITGDAAALAAGGVELGSGSLSYCGWSSYYAATEFIPENPKLRAPASGNVMVSFPRTYTKTLDPVKKEATFEATSFYGFRWAVIDQITAYCPGATRKAFTITHLGNENGGMFQGLNLSIIMLNWIVEATGRYRSKVMIARPNVEAPNADHPGVHLITSFTMLHVLADVSTCPQAVFTQREQFVKNPQVFMSKPNLTAYRSGNNLKVKLACAHYHVPMSYEGAIYTIFDLNLATSQIDTLAVGSISRILIDPCVMWPGVGMTDVTLVSNNPENTSITPPAIGPYQYTGGGAAIYVKSGSGYIVPCSVYPETGWILFITAGIKLMINGTSYEMEGGTIDLRDVDPAPQNKTFWVYATIEDNKPKFIVSAVKLRRRSSLLPACTLTTNDKQILTIVRHQPFLIGDYMLSYTREAGIIPVSSGFPQDAGNFSFLRNAELLP